MNDEPCEALILLLLPLLFLLALLLPLLLPLLEELSSPGGRDSGGGGGGSDDGAGRKAASGRDFGPGEASPLARRISPGVGGANSLVAKPALPRSPAADAEPGACARGAGRVALSEERRAAADCDRVRRCCPDDGCNIFVITSVLAKLTA